MCELTRSCDRICVAFVAVECPNNIIFASWDVDKIEKKKQDLDAKQDTKKKSGKVYTDRAPMERFKSIFNQQLADAMEIPFLNIGGAGTPVEWVHEEVNGSSELPSKQTILLDLQERVLMPPTMSVQVSPAAEQSSTKPAEGSGTAASQSPASSDETPETSPRGGKIAPIGGDPLFSEEKLDNELDAFDATGKHPLVREFASIALQGLRDRLATYPKPRDEDKDTMRFDHMHSAVAAHITNLVDTYFDSFAQGQSSQAQFHRQRLWAKLENLKNQQGSSERQKSEHLKFSLAQFIAKHYCRMWWAQFEEDALDYYTDEDERKEADKKKGQDYKAGGYLFVAKWVIKKDDSEVKPPKAPESWPYVRSHESFQEHTEWAMRLVYMIGKLAVNPAFSTINVHRHADLGKVAKVVTSADSNDEQLQIQGLTLLRDALELIDICNHMAVRCKRLAKLLYALQLIIGATIVTLTVVYMDELRTTENDGWLPWIIFVLSIAVTFVASMDAMLHPSNRWKATRGVAALMETGVFLYRTSTGPFKRTKAPTPHKRNELLYEMVIEARRSLADGANIRETGYQKNYSPTVFKHGQRPQKGEREKREKEKASWLPKNASWLPKNGRVAPEEPLLATMQLVDLLAVGCKSIHGDQLVKDDYYSGLSTPGYIAFRLEPALKFYRRRIPVYRRQMTAINVFLLLASVASAIIAYGGLAGYVALVSAWSVTILSWSEFKGLRGKLSRYNDAARLLSDNLTWWRHLTRIEQANNPNFDRLVRDTEAIINAERDAWQATAAKKGNADDDEVREDMNKKKINTVDQPLEQTDDYLA